MEPYFADQRVQELLDFADEGPLQVPIDSGQFLLQSQEINRWDRAPLSNEYFKRLSAEHFRSKNSCILGNYDERGGVALVVQDKKGSERYKKPIGTAQATTKRSFIERALPRSGYLPPRKTFTPPLCSNLDFVHTNMERKSRISKPSRSNKGPMRRSGSTEFEMPKDGLNLPNAPYFPNKRLPNVKISNFSFEKAWPIDPLAQQQKNERAQVDSMKQEALARRLRYQSNSERDEPPAISFENAAETHYLLHNFRTKRLMKNRKLELIL